MASINVHELMPGCKLVECGNEIILAGAPPEVIKALMLKDLPQPSSILIPDRLLIGDNLQNCTEFPLYHFLFVSGGLAKNKKLKIIGHHQYLKNNEELLRLTLLGPTKPELDKLGIDDELKEMFIKESDYFALKDKDGKILGINSFIDNYPFDDQGKTQIDGITISRHQYNQFKFEWNNEEVIVNLETDEKQLPPYPVQADCTPNELCKFGIEILGGATGFSANSASSGLVFVYNGHYILIDCIPYLDHHLIARGIAKSQIKAMFLSHIHDDHCNLLPLLHTVNKIQIITTKEIYWMAIYKLALQLNRPISDIIHYFELVPVTVGKTLDYYGLKIKPHYTVHTIPTIGAKFFIQDHGKISSALISSDNQSLDDIQIMFEQGIVSESRFKLLLNLYGEEVDLFFADGGEGTLHGAPQDALVSKAHRIIFFHLEKLPQEFDSSFSVASAGKRYVIVQGNTDYYTTRAIEFLLHHFEGIEDRWLSIIMGNMQITRYNTDDVIIKQGSETKNKIYIILTGHCSVLTHDGKKATVIAKKEAGDIFGEMAITTGVKTRNASIIAQSPVTVCEMSEEIFYALIYKEKIKDKLIEKWKTRKQLEELNYINTFPSQILEKLASHGDLIHLPENEIVDTPDIYFYIIISGSIEELHENNSNITLENGQFFGHFSYVANKNCRYKCSKSTVLLRFEKNIIRDLLSKTPLLLFSLKEVVYQEQLSQSN